MFFTLRCTFWLGVVFIAIHHNAPDSEFSPDRAVARRVPAISASLARAAAKSCSRAPRSCAELEKNAEGFVSSAIEVAAKRPSAQSLRAADLEPPWRGAALR